MVSSYNKFNEKYKAKKEQPSNSNATLNDISV